MFPTAMLGDSPMLASFISLLDNVWGNIAAALVLLALGWFWSRWHTLRMWQTKQFKDRMVLSLNTVQKVDGKYKLTLRTLFEKDVYEVLQNRSMVRIVEHAIDQVTPENPLLKIDKENTWYVLNAILNKIAEQFDDGILRRDMGLDVTTKRYVFCLTFEKEGGLRMQKIRVMLIQKESLLEFPESGEILLESEKHSTRIQTLRLLKQEYNKDPSLFMELELYQ